MAFLSKWGPVLFIALTIFLESAIPGKTINTLGLGSERLHISGHFFLYILLSLFLYRATRSVFKSVLFSVLYGITDEIHQLFVPFRGATLFDVFIDSLGSILGGGVAFLYSKRQDNCRLLSTLEETKRFAFEFAKSAKAGSVVALYGDLGSGKTAFTGYLVKALGFSDVVCSPTFIIIRKYDRGNGVGEISHINHIDLYRLNNADEALDTGVMEIIEEKDAVTIIEWPESIEKHLPAESRKLKFEYISENERKVCIKS